MRWSKIKNIIILLLVLVNGFLLGQVGLRALRSFRQKSRLERTSQQAMTAIPPYQMGGSWSARTICQAYSTSWTTCWLLV